MQLLLLIFLFMFLAGSEGRKRGKPPKWVKDGDMSGNHYRRPYDPPYHVIVRDYDDRY